jgi:hypothetical protein
VAVLSTAQIKELILLEVGDLDASTGDPASPGLLAGRIDMLWDRYAAKDLVAPGLRELYTKRACLRLVLAVLAPRRFDAADTSAGPNIKANQIYQHYWDLYDCIKGEIGAVEQQAATGARDYRAGRLTTAAPITAAYPPEANALRYGGTPYRARRGRVHRSP